MSGHTSDPIAARVAVHRGPDGSVILSPRVASWVKQRLGTALDRRVPMRVTDIGAYAELTALYDAGLEYESGSRRTASGPEMATRQRNSTDCLLTTAEAARLAGVTESTVRKWIRTRKLPAQRHGRRVWLVQRHHLTAVTAFDA